MRNRLTIQGLIAALIAALVTALAVPADPSAAAAAAAPKPPHHHRLHIDRSGRVQTGKASYYGARAAAHKTAAGGRPGRLTAASRTLPLGTRARVVERHTGRSVQVTVTDRGPFAKGRILDVSPAAARKLGMTHEGVAQVKVQPLHEPRAGAKPQGLRRPLIAERGIRRAPAPAGRPRPGPPREGGR